MAQEERQSLEGPSLVYVNVTYRSCIMMGSCPYKPIISEKMEKWKMHLTPLTCGTS